MEYRKGGEEQNCKLNVVQCVALEVSVLCFGVHLSSRLYKIGTSKLQP